MAQLRQSGRSECPRNHPLVGEPALDEHNLYPDFYVVNIVRRSSLLSIECRIWVIPALVEEAIVREAKRVWLIVFRVLRHGANVRWVVELRAN